MKKQLKTSLATILLILAFSASSKADTVSGGSGTFSALWANATGSNYTNSFTYNLFDSNLGTLNSVEFCLVTEGTGDWSAEFGPGSTPPQLDITMFGGQTINVDGGSAWLTAGFVPVIDNYDIADSVTVLNVTTPFSIMSPTNGPSFAWSDSTVYNLPNTSLFIGTGTASATFTADALISYISTPAEAVALEGHNYDWSSLWEVKYHYTPVPEPGSAILLGVSSLALLRRRRGKTL
ncbi:MAG: choice-of-anchor E domain-containing protein [Verrucomicrobiaceae bacterium]|nr:choice-of-anchor E domain-containing protein [Verrucomicrobiaceae bacterium]